MKRCVCCNVPKEESEFNKNKTTKDGLCYDCKDCNKARSKANYKLRTADKPKRAKSISVSRERSYSGNDLSKIQKKRIRQDRVVKYGQDVVDILEAEPKFERLGKFEY